MAESKELVRFIRYEFSITNLLMPLNGLELNLYKIDESVQKYIYLCEKELQRVYPEASIEVISHDDTSIDDSENDTSVDNLEIYVESLINFEEMPDPDEFDTVASICELVFSERLNDWAISKDFRPITQIKSHAKLPMTVIRWLCSQGLIEASSKMTGRWHILFDDVPKMHDQVLFVDSAVQLERLTNQVVVIAGCLEDLADVSVMNFPENIKFLVASKEGFDKQLFKADNTLCHINRAGSRLELEIEHFIDTVGWSGWKWSYQEWTLALREQAGRKGVACKIQFAERNDADEVDGISFVLSVNVRQETTIQTLIQNGLGELSNIIDYADLSLKGGPVWDDEADKIYQKDEIRFHKEVLYPLLDKMYEGRVFYTHSNRGEHGRDFVFTETTKFQETMYYGLQAKAGNVSGGANDDIDTLVIQIKRAFIMPLKLDVKRQDDYISVMIIAISGDFTSDAKDVMRHEIPKRLVGSVYFWNKEKILALIAEKWRKEND